MHPSLVSYCNVCAILRILFNQGTPMLSLVRINKQYFLVLCRTLVYGIILPPLIINFSRSFPTSRSYSNLPTPPFMLTLKCQINVSSRLLILRFFPASWTLLGSPSINFKEINFFTNQKKVGWISNSKF